MTTSMSQSYVPCPYGAPYPCGHCIYAAYEQALADMARQEAELFAQIAAYQAAMCAPVPRERAMVLRDPSLP